MTSILFHRARADRLLRRVAMAPAFCLGLLLGWSLWPGPAPPTPTVAPSIVAQPAPGLAGAPPRDPGPGDAQLLRAALREARANCLVAALTEEDLGPDRRPLFGTEALRAALETGLIERQAYGEVESIAREARWLSTLDPTSDLGERSWEDVRFLLGGVHWYLENAAGDLPGEPGPAHGTPDHGYDHTRMRAFAGLEFTDLLGLWD